jgi:glycyl-radical enzyme activating protein
VPRLTAALLPDTVDPMDAPLIVSVQHFCLHDGPGIRSIVFFKGCPLRCPWCQNPEAWSAGPSLAHKQQLCVGCGTCVASCPTGSLARPGARDLSRCRQEVCFACAASCPTGATTCIGTPAGVEDLLQEIRPDYPFFARSGGGVTLSGGEPTLFPVFAAELAGRLREDGVHVALETCGQLDLERAGPLLSALDLVLFDVKIFDDERLRTLCGGDGERIRHNLRALATAARAGTGPVVWPRLPLVPGLTDDAENLAGWGRLLAELGLRQITLVPYHRLGLSKRGWLGLDPGPRFDLPSGAELDAARGHLAALGIASHSPGEEPWDGLPGDLVYNGAPRLSEGEPSR